jgi:alkanesulfonate monooxygenase SsuD/methylene tetrahydromethanopterin reductase-like flavin-dependent oxidoreductase (luciferase family)
MYRASGFGAEADQMEEGVGPDALSDRLLDSFCLFGPIERCHERLAEFRAAGVDLPILNPPIGPDAARAVIEAFRREPTSPAAAPSGPQAS